MEAGSQQDPVATTGGGAAAEVHCAVPVVLRTPCVAPGHTADVEGSAPGLELRRGEKHMCGGGLPWAGKHNVSGKNTWAGVRCCNGSRPVLQGAARGSVCVCAYVHCVHSDPVCAGHTCPTVSNTPDFVWINTKILAFPRPCGTNVLYRSPFGSAQTVAIAGHQARAISLELDERAKSDRAIEMFEHAPDGKLCDRPRQADRRRQV